MLEGDPSGSFCLFDLAKCKPRLEVYLSHPLVVPCPGVTASHRENCSLQIQVWPGVCHFPR